MFCKYELLDEFPEYQEDMRQYETRMATQFSHELPLDFGSYSGTMLPLRMSRGHHVAPRDNT